MPPGALTPMARYRQPDARAGHGFAWRFGKFLLWVVVFVLMVTGGAAGGLYLYGHDFAAATAPHSAAMKRAAKKLDFVSLTREIPAHDQHLVDQINAYAARDYAQAQQMETHGYQQMVSVSNLFVGAIQRRVQNSMPVGGTKTGGGGTASRPR